METSIYKEFSKERKALQEANRVPEWITTPSWQLLKEKYLDDSTPDLKCLYTRVANCAASHLPDSHTWSARFFELMWKGWLSPSTPVLANMGTDRGSPVSCSGSYIDDSIFGFYDNRTEGALLSKEGFGTSGYLGDIRHRGSVISSGGLADGVVPVFRGHRRMAQDVSQGQQRRGSWAGYLPIEHGDFYELLNFVENNPDDSNVGWNVSNQFSQELNEGDTEAQDRFAKAMKVKMMLGKGYFFFPDKANALNPPMYEAHNLSVKASNLCTEIMLHSDADHTFTCVLSSMNLARFDEWKDTDAVKYATVFLDCVAQEFIERGKTIQGLEKAVRFTERSRALGLGTLGFHTYLMQKGVAIESLEAAGINNQIFSHIRSQADEATKEMAESLGEPDWCRGFGVRNTHLLAIAPNLSTALVCGGVSQGIEPTYAGFYEQSTPAGTVNRANPVLVKIMRERGVYNEDEIGKILEDNGSVQLVDWLAPEEKEVFKTAFEIDQHVLVRLAGQRQRHIDQGQSLNLFFAAEAEGSYITSVHKEAFNNPYIKSLYYIRSKAGVRGSDGECVACAD